MPAKMSFSFWWEYNELKYFDKLKYQKFPTVMLYKKRNYEEAESCH